MLLLPSQSVDLVLPPAACAGGRIAALELIAAFTADGACWCSYIRVGACFLDVFVGRLTIGCGRTHWLRGAGIRLDLVGIFVVVVVKMAQITLAVIRVQSFSVIPRQ